MMHVVHHDQRCPFMMQKRDLLCGQGTREPLEINLSCVAPYSFRAVMVMTMCNMVE